MSTGDASSSPTTKPSLNTIISGSVGLVNVSLPLGRYWAIGALRSATSCSFSTSQSPAPNPTTIAPRARSNRMRSSSR